MVLVDTSVWVDHLRTGNKALAHLLNNAEVLAHPFIIGEIACGNLANRHEVLSSLQALPALVVAGEPEVLYFIEQNQLMGLGIGYIDAHLLAATILVPSTRLWTRDKRLKTVADGLNLAYQASA